MGTMPFREELSWEARDFSHERTSLCAAIRDFYDLGVDHRP